MRKQITYLLLGLFMLLLTACESRPKEILDNKTMESVMYDLYTFEGEAAVSGMAVGTSEKSPYYNAILEKHNITNAQFDSSLVWYAAHPSKFEVLHKTVVEKLQKQIPQQPAEK